MQCIDCKNDLTYYPNTYKQSLYCAFCKKVFNTEYMKQFYGFKEEKMGLKIGRSIIDIFLAAKIIENNMKENNITDPNLVDEKIIQEKYNEIMERQTSEFPHIRCPQCNFISYNSNDIKYKYCGHCNEWHEFMELKNS